MASMDTTIDLKAGLKGGLLRQHGSHVCRRELDHHTFTAQHGAGEIMFAPGPAGDILHYALSGGRLMLQRGAYLANGPGVELSAKWEGARLLLGQGLVLLQASGSETCSSTRTALCWRWMSATS